jgi:hypothetical protein
MQILLHLFVRAAARQGRRGGARVINRTRFKPMSSPPAPLKRLTNFMASQNKSTTPPQRPRLLEANLRDVPARAAPATTTAPAGCAQRRWAAGG